VKSVVAVSGLSGVGKSTLIAKLGATIPLHHLQAGALIKQARQAMGEVAVTHDQLRSLNLEQNQELLIRGFKLKQQSCPGLIVLDCHTVIEHDAQLTRIEPLVFGAIGIDKMIFLIDDPQSIAVRRQKDLTRSRPVLTVERLRLIQEEGADHAAKICSTLGVPLHKFRPDEAELISEVLSNLDDRFRESCHKRGDSSGF
jgi:adenylate kinase